MSSMLKPKQRYYAGVLFGMALHQAQIQQTHPLQSISDKHLHLEKRISSVLDNPDLWVDDSSDLLKPIFRVLGIEDEPCTVLEETVGTSSANHHVGAFLKLLAEESGDASTEVKDGELALSKAVDAVLSNIGTSADIMSKKEKHREYENECREKFSTAEFQSQSEVEHKGLEDQLDKRDKLSTTCDAPIVSGNKPNTKPLEEESMLGYQKKLAFLYELLSACLAVTPKTNSESPRRRKGYDARHRVAMRLLATWLNVSWIRMEALETIVACSAMAILKEEQSKELETHSSENSWDWKRGGMIGAAALTGGTLMAITGGLVAPAIAAGFSALAPTLGTIIPAIGASGFAAAATAAGSAAGSVAVAASFGAAGAGLTGIKMARRIGSLDEFEFKALGENHNQGQLAVEILISGFVFEEQDYVRPWEGHTNNSERYVLQWESKNLIAVSTAIQDWLTSQLAMEMMKQGAMLTVLHTLLTALAWPAALLTLTDLIDSKWAIAVDRSEKAGEVLAKEVLLKDLQGHRPVTLVGFSLGARVIFKCLQVLAEDERNAGLVERVVLLGSPIAIKDENWEGTRKVVAGRFVNAFSTNDWMLGVVFRASLLTQGLAGIQPINVPGIENVNVTEYIEGHSSYLWATQQILEKLDIDAYFPVVNATLMKP